MAATAVAGWAAGPGAVGSAAAMAVVVWAAVMVVADSAEA